MIDDVGHCIMKYHVEGETGRGRSQRARGHYGLNERMVGADDPKNW